MKYDQKLRGARQYLGLTQVELAKLLGISLHNLGEYERGHKQPTDAVIVNLKLKTGIMIDYLPDFIVTEMRKIKFTRSELYPLMIRIKQFIKMFSFSSYVYDQYARALLKNNGVLIVGQSLEKPFDIVISLSNYGFVYIQDDNRFALVRYEDSEVLDLEIPKHINNLIVAKLTLPQAE